jgi:CRP/FNR family transcriptional regulator, cyclic AMP receptor protein
MADWKSTNRCGKFSEGLLGLACNPLAARDLLEFTLGFLTLSRAERTVQYYILNRIHAICFMVSTAARRAPAKGSRPSKKANLRTSAFDVESFLDSAGLGRRVVKYLQKETVFGQGDLAKHVMYIQEGRIKLTVVNEEGKEAVVAVLGPGDFLGEGCLAGQSICMATATAIASATVLVIEKHEMIRVLHAEHEFSDRFIAYTLARNIRVEEDLVDQLFNSSEKRLARTLLLLARYGAQGQPQKVLPKVSQETLAEMIGTTRSRVNFFMNKFRKLGFIEYNGEIHVNNSLLSVVLHE